ncbi:MAG TPA: ABC transporter substrate-binding protein [Bryobacteraceae bacterium]|nr:ABC transporter substrate-binding protein [Bryobacteraceae bacterium]
MRPLHWLPLAVLSAAALCGAATRPHYGGTLRIEMRSATPDSGPLASLAFETLVRLDASGVAQPCLAVSWQHDTAFRRWQFNLRPGVRFHDGSPLSAAAVVASLEEALPGMALGGNGETVTIRADRPVPDLLLVLAHDARIMGRDNLGTGPFRLTAFDPGHHAAFAANEDYWGGRPFLDAIDIQLGRALRDQFADLELGKIDVAELAPADVRRASAHGRAIWTSGAVNLIALRCAPDSRLCEALALSIDRAAMHTVLLQKQGEITAALLPQWISGYAFAFPTEQDLARARSLTTALQAAARTVSLSYDPAIPASRALADRIAVNARDAGITVQVSAQNAQAALRLAEIRLPSVSPARALTALAAALKLETPATAFTVAALYDAERKLLDGDRVIPLFYVPDEYGAAARVRVYAPPPVTRAGEWRFENVWLAGAAP